MVSRAFRGGFIGVAVLLTMVLVPTVVGVGSSAWAAPAVQVFHGSRDSPRVALTFDDNYHPKRATRVLEILRRYEVPATVFVLGWYVDEYPEITGALTTAPVEIGDHTTSHSKLSELPASRLSGELGGGTGAYRRVTGRRTVPFYRPPYGKTGPAVRAAAGAKGFLYEVMWDVDSADWQGRSAFEIERTVLDNVRNGSIVLMHLSAENTAAALPGVIAGLRARGYELVTVSTLLKEGRRFFDIPAKGAEADAVGAVFDAGIMRGYDADYFGPADGITRAQLAKATGIVAGHEGPDGSLRSDPDAEVDRLQLAVTLAAMARELKGYGGPSDEIPNEAHVYADVPDWAQRDVGLATSLGLMGGYSGHRFEPAAPATRLQVAMVMARFRDLPMISSAIADTSAAPGAPLFDRGQAAGEPFGPRFPMLPIPARRKRKRPDLLTRKPYRVYRANSS